MSRNPEFASEAEMCQAFIAWLARFPGWTAYPETHNWDILLAHQDGTQIGVQAKLKFNMKVLEQTVDNWWASSSVGPDFRAILVPSTQGGQYICSALGIGMFSGHCDRPYRSDQAPRYDFDPHLNAHAHRAWHYQNPDERHELPRYVPDVPAGVSAPSTLSRWKIAALEIVATLEVCGRVTRADFTRAGIDHRRWTQNWLRPVQGVPGAWCARSDMPDFAAQHVIVYPQVLADIRERLAGELVPRGHPPTPQPPRAEAVG